MIKINDAGKNTGSCRIKGRVSRDFWPSIVFLLGHENDVELVSIAVSILNTKFRSVLSALDPAHRWHTNYIKLNFKETTLEKQRPICIFRRISSLFANWLSECYILYPSG